MSDQHADLDALLAASREDPRYTNPEDSDPARDPWRRLQDVFAGDFEGAWEAACDRADEIAKYMRRRTARRAPFDKRVRKVRAAIAKLEARIEALEQAAVDSCKPIQDSIDLRQRVLDEFRTDYAPQLHLKKAKSIVFPAGEFRFHSNQTRKDFVRGEDDKRDTEKLEAWANQLYDLGLAEVWEGLMPSGERQLDAQRLKGCVELFNGKPWFEVIVSDPLPAELQARIDDEDDGTHAVAEKTDQATGEVLSWLVSIPFVYAEKTPEGEVIREVDLFREYRPEDRGEAPYTLEFIPAEEE